MELEWTELEMSDEDYEQEKFLEENNMKDDSYR
jgi:hypothetical protein